MNSNIRRSWCSWMQEIRTGMRDKEMQEMDWIDVEDWEIEYYAQIDVYIM